MAEKRRLFFALWPDDRVRAAILRAGLAVSRARALGGREVPAERIHLTLLFLGDATARQQELLVRGAGELGGRSFDLRLDQAACFYRTRVFWVGAASAPARMTALWQGLCDVAALAGLEPDHRPLAPHVTVARDIRHRIRPVPVEPITWPVRSFALVHSEQKIGTPPNFQGARSADTGPAEIRGRPHFPQYHVVSQWPLQNASAPFVKTVQEPGGPE